MVCSFVAQLWDGKKIEIIRKKHWTSAYSGVCTTMLVDKQTVTLECDQYFFLVEWHDDIRFSSHGWGSFLLLECYVVHTLAGNLRALNFHSDTLFWIDIELWTVVFSLWISHMSGTELVYTPVRCRQTKYTKKTTIDLLGVRTLDSSMQTAPVLVRSHATRHEYGQSWIVPESILNCIQFTRVLLINTMVKLDNVSIHTVSC